MARPYSGNENTRGGDTEHGYDGAGTWQFSVLVYLWDGGVDQALLGAEGVELVFGRADLNFERTLSSHALGERELKCFSIA